MAEVRGAAGCSGCGVLHASHPVKAQHGCPARMWSCCAERCTPGVQVRDRATLYITQLQEADGQPVPQPAPWNISSKSLEAALQAYLEDGGQLAPFDLVRHPTEKHWV